MTKVNMYKIGEVQLHSFRVMRADRQTDTQTDSGIATGKTEGTRLPLVPRTGLGFIQIRQEVGQGVGYHYVPSGSFKIV